MPCVNIVRTSIDETLHTNLTAGPDEFAMMYGRQSPVPVGGGAGPSRRHRIQQTLTSDL